MLFRSTVRIEVKAEGYAPRVLTASLVPGPQAQTITLQKAGPRAHMVTLDIQPMGTAIYEGARLIGKSPKVWTDALEGEHELSFQHEGYHPDKARVVVSRDGEDFSFKSLRKLETARKAAPELGIKAER